MNMKISSLFLTFLIGSVVTVAADDRGDHSDNKERKSLRASAGSAAAQGTAFALFDGKLETDSSLMTVDDKTIMALDKEMEDALKGMDEVERSIQLAAFKDFTQNKMTLEEINKRYLPHGDGDLDVGTKTAFMPCCRNPYPRKCLTGTEICIKECRWITVPNFFVNICCHPNDRGKKFWVWEDCR